ncbi:replication protein, partial [mine drainage metagenome]
MDSPLLLDIEQLPRRPYCSDDLTYGLQIRPRETAVKKRLIQINPPGICRFLIFDIDRIGAALAWEDASLPEPTWS